MKKLINSTPLVPGINAEATGKNWLKYATEESLASTLIFGSFRYGDKNWFYQKGASGAPQNILLDYLYEDETVRADSYASIRASSKRFLLCMANYPPINVRPIGTFGSLHQIAGQLRQFNLFLFKNKIYDYSEVGISDLRIYLQQVAGVRENGKKVTARTVESHILLLHNLWLCKEKMPSGIKAHILYGKTVKELAKEITDDAQWENGDTSSIPDSIFISILSNALDWITTKMPVFTKIFDIYSSQESSFIRTKKINQLGWEHLDKIFPLKYSARDNAFAKFRIIRRHMISACAIAILALVGLRSHEILSLEEDCVSSIEGGDDYGIFLILARTHKTTGQPWGERLTWVAPNVVKEALLLLIKMNRGSSRSNNRLFAAGRGARAEMTRGTLQININEFAIRTNVEMASTQQDGSLKRWHFANHQFRKTFAQWVGTASAKSNIALMHHFKHLSLATTDGYIGTDFELYAEIAAHIEKSTSERLRSILAHSPNIGGLAGKEIKAKLSEASIEFLGTEGEDALRYRIEEDLKIAVRAGLTVVDCEYAYCLRRMDNKPKCGGKIANRGPDVCPECNNFVVTPIHKKWWEQNLVNNEIMLIRHIEVGASDNQLSVLKKIADDSRSALSTIKKWINDDQDE